MSKNFKYLDDLIHSGLIGIVLDSDIVLGDGEESQYPEGIKMDVDDLIIDGNGHIVDAKGKTRIFFCKGKNITIKNIILKNGFAEGEFMMKRCPECGRKVDSYSETCPFCMAYIGEGYVDEDSLEMDRMIEQDYRDSY